MELGSTSSAAILAALPSRGWARFAGVLSNAEIPASAADYVRRIRLAAPWENPE